MEIGISISMRDTACLDAYSRILTPYTKPFLAPLTTDKRSWFAGLSNVTRVSVKNRCVKEGGLAYGEIAGWRTLLRGENGVWL